MLFLEINIFAFGNISDNNRNENNRSMSKQNKNNPFKFGTLVEGEYFTDRVRELDYVKQVLASENHLVLISPRRYGKTSLVHKAAIETGRPVMFVNLEAMTDKHDLAVAFLNRLFKLYPFERLKNMLRNFRFVPTLSSNPIGDTVSFSFVPEVNTDAVLEDVMTMMDNVSTREKKLIVVIDEFQEVNEIEKRLDRQLRAIMQMQSNINYVLLGSQESMMHEIFEHKKSPFYHFGTVMTLSRIPREDFIQFLKDRLTPLAGGENTECICHTILDFTQCHPYYTQQLAFHVWNILQTQPESTDVVEEAIKLSNQIHDADYRLLWTNLNKTDKRVVRFLAKSEVSPLNSTSGIGIASSTVFSSLQRLCRSGYVVKDETYHLDDPFFSRWVEQYM